jgi:IS5 family transposase
MIFSPREIGRLCRIPETVVIIEILGSILISGNHKMIFIALQFLRVLGAEVMAADDFSRVQLDGMVDTSHLLAVLARKTPWTEIETALIPAFAHKERKGRSVEAADMFGPTLSVAGVGVSPAGQSRLPIRLMVSLLYLKHAFNQIDESVVERWSENVVWQLFTGMDYCTWSDSSSGQRNAKPPTPGSQQRPH